MSRFSDDLNRADAGTLGSDYSPASGQSSHGLVSNTAQQPSLGSPAAADYSNLVTAITPGADQFAAADVDAMSAGGYSNGGAYVRGDTSGLQGYTFGIGSDGVTFIYDWIGDAFLATGAHSLAGGERFACTIRGAAVNGFIDGVLELSATNTSTASGRAGISSFGLDGISPGDVVFDDLEVGDLPIQVAGAGAEASAANGGLTLNAPASPSVGDLWLAIIHVSDQNAVSMDAAWTEVVQGNGGGSTSRLAVFQHRYTGSAPSLVVSHTGGQSPIGGILAFRATEAGEQVAVDVAGAITGGTDASIEHASITPTVDYGLLLLINGAADDNARTLPAGTLAGFEDAAGGTQNAYVTTAGAPDGSVSAIYRDSMAAATGVIAITQAASDPWASVQIALKAETAGGGEGAAAITLGDLVASGAAELEIAGAGAVTLDALSSAGTGEVDVAGAAAVTLEDLASAGSGALDVEAALAVTLDDVVASGAGDVELAGAAAVTLEDLSASGTGEVDLAAAAGVTLEDLSASGAGEVDLSGAASIVLEDLALSATAGSGASGELAVTLGDLVVVGAGELPIAGALAVTLEDLVGAGSGEVDLAGAGASTLEDLVVAGTGENQIAAVASITLDDVVASAAGEVDVAGAAAVTLEDLASAGSGALELVAAAAVTLADLVVVAFGGSGLFGAASLTLEDLSASGAGEIDLAAAAAVTLEDLSASGTGELDVAGAAAVTLEDLASAGSGALDVEAALAVTLEDLAVVGAGELPLAAAASVVLDDLALSALGLILTYEINAVFIGQEYASRLDIRLETAVVVSEPRQEFTTTIDIRDEDTTL